MEQKDPVRSKLNFGELSHQVGSAGGELATSLKGWLAELDNQMRPGCST